MFNRARAVRVDHGLGDVALVTERSRCTRSRVRTAFATGASVGQRRRLRACADGREDGQADHADHAGDLRNSLHQVSLYLWHIDASVEAATPRNE